MYYTCSARVNRSATACDLRAIRREALDAVVLDTVEQRLLDADHFRLLFSALLENSDEADTRRRRALASSRTRATDARTALSNLLTLVETGALSPADPMIVERLPSTVRLRRWLRQRSTASRSTQYFAQVDTPQMIDRFGASLKERLRTGDANFRRAYLARIVDKVVVSDSLIRISGSKPALEHSLIKDGATPSGVVPIFDRIGARRSLRRTGLSTDFPRCWENDGKTEQN